MPLLDVTMHFDNSVLAANDTVGTRFNHKHAPTLVPILFQDRSDADSALKTEGDLLAAQ